ncbi:Integrase, catalytic core [Senna tora]|uniref:Integrase, catalytic core n=1 Tax=Senna tora TaxID=362788 RepID=A0A835C633_9FABA|nr:Integrase, catalytic core [Senna tora]
MTTYSGAVTGTKSDAVAWSLSNSDQLDRIRKFGQGQKGYKIYNLESHKVEVSRDVIFYANVFPFSEPNLAGQEKGEIENGAPENVHTHNHLLEEQAMVEERV